MLQVYLAPTDHDAVTPQAEGQLPPALWLLHIENCEDNTWWFQCFKSTMIRFAESAECKGWKYRQNSVCLTVSLSPILFRPFFQHFFHPLEDLVKAVQTAQHMSEISMWEVSGIWQQGKTQGLVGFWEIKRWDSIWMYLVASRIYIYIYNIQTQLFFLARGLKPRTWSCKAPKESFSLRSVSGGCLSHLQGMSGSLESPSSESCTLW